MTAPTTGNPPAGWYTDPSNPAAERWYDGTAWTTHVQAPPPPPAPVEPAPVAQQYGYTPDVTTPLSSFGYTAPDPRFSYGTPDPRFSSTAPAPSTGWIQPVSSHYLANPSGDLSAGKNTPARVGLVVSILAMLGVPIAGIAGIILATIGLKRARTLESAGWAPKGRVQARWALSLSIIGLVLSSLLAVLAVRTYLVEALTYDSQAVETEITAGIAAQLGVDVTVQCPDELVGTTVQCIAVGPDGTPASVDVDFSDPTRWTWQLSG